MASPIVQRPVATLSAARIRATRIDPAVGVGIVALLGAIALALAAPPTLLSAGLGIVAVAGLGRHPTLGFVPAALLALIAVPYGRAADNDLASIGGIPIRFQDGVVAAALVYGVVSIRSIDLRPGIVRLLLAFLAVGAVAGVVGLLGDAAVRDVVRDARWWALYGFGLLAIWGRVDRRSIIRAVMVGATIYSFVLIATAILPVIDGALKDRALTYDWGRLRLQFSNSAFLIPPMAYLAARTMTRPNIRDAAWLVLLGTAVVLAATRVSILAGVGTVGLAALWTAWQHPAPFVVQTRRLVVVAALLVISFGSAVGVLRTASVVAIATLPKAESAAGGGQGDAGFVDRILFQDPTSSVDAIEQGRFATYRSAVAVIDDSPIIGSGLGTLVPIDFTFGGSRPSTPGMQPGVDDAYLTVAMKAGIVGAAVFALLMAWPLWMAFRRRRDRLAWWFVPGWLGVIALSITQSFATSGYGPFGVSLLLVVLALRPTSAASAASAAPPVVRHDR
jgi:hypothetical protein